MAQGPSIPIEPDLASAAAAAMFLLFACDESGNREPGPNDDDLSADASVWVDLSELPFKVQLPGAERRPPNLRLVQSSQPSESTTARAWGVRPLRSDHFRIELEPTGFSWRALP